MFKSALSACTGLLLALLMPGWVNAYTVLCVGDSITAGYKATPYPVYLQQMLGAEATVINVAIPGEQTSGGLSRLNGHMKTYQPQYVLIMEGANDVIQGVSPSTVKFNLAKMIDTVRAYNATPIISTITPNRRDQGLGPLIPGSYNPGISGLASQTGTALVDSYSAVVGSWATLSFDGLHPTNEGSQVLANGFRAALPGSGGSGGGGGCFIATAAFGSQLAPHVVLLRRFRDAVLLKHPLGQRFVAWYYRISPPIADWIVAHDSLRFIVRGLLYPLVGLAYCLVHGGTLALVAVIGGIGLLFLWMIRRRPSLLKQV